MNGRSLAMCLAQNALPASSCDQLRNATSHTERLREEENPNYIKYITQDGKILRRAQMKTIESIQRERLYVFIKTDQKGSVSTKRLRYWFWLTTEIASTPRGLAALMQ